MTVISASVPIFRAWEGQNEPNLGLVPLICKHLPRSVVQVTLRLYASNGTMDEVVEDVIAIRWRAVSRFIESKPNLKVVGLRLRRESDDEPGRSWPELAKLHITLQLREFKVETGKRFYSHAYTPG